MIPVIAVVLTIVMVLAYFLRSRNICTQRPSVVDRRAYCQLAIAPLVSTNTHMYEDPLNYKRKRGRLVATSPQLLLVEKTINSRFCDKLPWCLPPTYCDLEMNGAFPSVETCRLQALCKTMTENVDVFRTEFNTNKCHFDENPEKLGYGSHYGRIVVNEIRDKFPQTCKILGSSVDYARTKSFTDYAGGNVFVTAFTVLFPGASIRPHFGPSNFRYRIHLCLDIDGVGGIVTPFGTRTWEVGKIFILDDAYLHAGFYEGTRPRVILMVDIAKPGLTFEDINTHIKSKLIS